MISENCKHKILESAKIETTVTAFTELKKAGSSLLGTCSKCGKDKKLSVHRAKNIVSCFVCDIKGLTPVNYLMEYQNKSFPEALEWLANELNIQLEFEPNPKKQIKTKQNKFTIKKKPGANKKSNTFCSQQLLWNSERPWR